MVNSNKIVVFAPHPDDEILGCGGLIIKRVLEGFDITVIFLTDGGNALSKSFGICTEPSPTELKEIRKEEAKKASKILGVKGENLAFLEIEDGHLEENAFSAEKKIREMLSGMTFSEIYFPSRRETHPDHRAAYDIVLKIIGELDCVGEAYCYTILRKSNYLAPIEKLSNLFRNNTIRVDISKHLYLKEKALNEYKSQTTIIARNQKKPVLDSRFLEHAGLHCNEEIFFKCKL